MTAELAHASIRSCLVTQPLWRQNPDCQSAGARARFGFGSRNVSVTLDFETFQLRNADSRLINSESSAGTKSEHALGFVIPQVISPPPRAIYSEEKTRRRAPVLVTAAQVDCKEYRVCMSSAFGLDFSDSSVKRLR